MRVVPTDTNPLMTPLIVMSFRVGKNKSSSTSTLEIEWTILNMKTLA